MDTEFRPPLSSYLAHHIAFLDEELTAEELAEYAAEREGLLKSVESFWQLEKGVNAFVVLGLLQEAAAKVPDVMRGMKDSAEWSLDDCLSRLMVSEVPRMVSRTLRLRPLIVDQDARIDESPYLAEATRCYIFGLFHAAVALSRSALEAALSKKVPSLLHSSCREEFLKALISTARVSVLKRSPEIGNLADKIRRQANAIIHGRKCTESEAEEILQNTRTVLRFLYGPLRPRKA